MQAAAEAAGHDDWDGFVGDKMQAAAEAAGYDDWDDMCHANQQTAAAAGGHDNWDDMCHANQQAAAEAAGFSSHGGHSQFSGVKRGKGKESPEDRDVRRQAELNNISGGGWTHWTTS